MILKFNQFNESITIQPTDISEFGVSYSSKFIISEHKFFDIINEDGYKVGEIEWGQVDNETIEIVSIHIDKNFRGRNYGVGAFESLVRTLDVNNVILKAATSSKPFWRKLGFLPISGVRDYYKKEIR
jgi:ribosomal protein S18 acetylase RimI-like enzyme